MSFYKKYVIVLFILFVFSSAVYATDWLDYVQYNYNVFDCAAEINDKVDLVARPIILKQTFIEPKSSSITIPIDKSKGDKIIFVVDDINKYQNAIKKLDEAKSIVLDLRSNLDWQSKIGRPLANQLARVMGWSYSVSDNYQTMVWASLVPARLCDETSYEKFNSDEVWNAGMVCKNEYPPCCDYPGDISRPTCQFYEDIYSSIIPTLVVGYKVIGPCEGMPYNIDKTTPYLPFPAGADASYYSIMGGYRDITQTLAPVGTSFCKFLGDQIYPVGSKCPLRNC